MPDSMGNNSFFKDDFIDENRKHLENWPYGVNQIDETIDPDLISARGRQELYHALKLESPVAFVGSGVSAAYGRMSWRRLREIQDREVRRRAEDFDRWADDILRKLNRKNNNPVIESNFRFLFNLISTIRSDIGRTRKTFENMNADISGRSSGEVYPIQLEVARNLHGILKSYRDTWLKINKGFFDWDVLKQDLPEIEELRDICPLKDVADIDFESFVRHLTYDEFAHCHDVVETAFIRRNPSLTPPKGTNNAAERAAAQQRAVELDDAVWRYMAGADSASFKSDSRPREQNMRKRDRPRVVPGLRNDKDAYDYLAGFGKERFKGLVDGFDPELKSVMPLLQAALTKEALTSKGEYVPPLKRYLVGMAIIAVNKEGQSTAEPILAETKALDESPDKRLKSRSSVVQPDMDPLLKLSDKLGIRRFLTTNYDLEIERLLQDQGFAIPHQLGDKDPRSVRISPLGRSAHDLTIGDRTAGELIAFNIDDDSTHFSVFHLHGRAVDQDPIVITERQYMDLYLKDDKNRTLINEAISLTFAANPIVFVGLGMTETDMLRPMRQFMSDQGRKGERVAVALLPALGSLRTQTQEVIINYMRYGVYTTHFGRVTYREESAPPTNRKAEVERGDPNFLGAFDLLVKKLRSALEECERQSDAKRTPSDVALDGFVRGLRESTDIAFASILLNGYAKDCPLPLRAMGERYLKRVEKIEGIQVDLEAPLSIVDEGLRIIHSDLTIACLRPRISLILYGLGHVLDHVLGSALSSALDALDRDVETWWQDWLDDPTRRLAKFYANPDAPPRRYQRHLIRPSYSDIDRQSEQRKALEPVPQGVPLKILDNFIKAADGRFEKPSHRRVFFVSSHRGVGKGVFFSALQSSTGFPPVCAALGVSRRKAGSDADDNIYECSAFINLSFAAEVSSVFDSLNSMLIGTLAKTLGNKNAKRIEGVANQLPRMGRLQFLLGRVDESLADSKRNRLLIALNGLDLLLRGDGQPKTREIAEFLDLITGEATARFRLDFIVVGSELQTPLTWRAKKKNEGLEFVPLLVGNLPTDIRHVAEKRIGQTGFRIKDKNTGGNLDRAAFFVHPARPLSVAGLLADNFPRLTLALLKNHYERLHLQKAFFSKQQKDADDAGLELSPSAKSALKFLGDNKIAKLMKVELREDDSQMAVELTRRKLEAALKSYQFVSPRLRDARRYLRHNRFAFTIMFAAAQRILDEPSVQDTARSGAELAADFVDKLIGEVIATSEVKREEVVLDHVLDAHERFHDASKGDADFHLQMLIMRHLAVFSQPTSADVLVRCPAVRRLLNERLLFSGEPMVSRHARVLQALKALANYGLVFEIETHPSIILLEGAAGKHKKKIKDKREHGVESARSENTTSADGDSDKTSNSDAAVDGSGPEEGRFRRFALHRLMQRHALRKMDGPLLNFERANQFAVGLYASLPSEIPKPSLEGHVFLREMMAGLSAYPDSSGMKGDTRYWHLSSAKRETQVQALRAALGIARTAFSIAVVSRFVDYDRETTGNASWLKDTGYFEEHRIQIRWLLRRAWNLSKGAPGRTDIQALYVDEIIWLYNECGLICLVQGKLKDAVTYFRHALRLNTEVEGAQDGGPQWARISVNLAVAQLERGNIDNAEMRLRMIENAPEEDPEVRGVAQGYLGLAAHLKGDYEAAKKLYGDALGTLTPLKAARALSIFNRHLGDLFRLRGQWREADLHLQNAVAHAGAGGHMDVYWKAQLARIKLRLSEGNAIDWKALFNEIKRIEDYAKKMDIPSLLCQTYHIRAEVLLERGESELAGSLIIKAMAIAKRHEMRLRLLGASTVYGRILRARDCEAAGMEVLACATRMAKRWGIQIEQERIEIALRRGAE